MAINKNHEFEELDGVKAAVVEKGVLPLRVAFLKELLEYNHYSVVVVPTPPPKTAAVPPKEGAIPIVTPATQPETFTVGVTDVSFNATNAIFGRALRTKDGHVVTLAYWQQKESRANDEIPYYDNANDAN
jgi:hypothetical protein